MARRFDQRTQAWLIAGLVLLSAGCSAAQAGSAALRASPSISPNPATSFTVRPSSAPVAASTVYTTVTPVQSVAEPVQPPSTTEVTATPTPPPQNQATIDGWVASFSNGVKFLGWTVTGDTVAGTYSETLLPPTATALTTDSSSFNGTINGSSVTLTFSHGFGSTISGQLASNTLSLSIPQTDGSIQVEVFTPGTTADYNTGVVIVQQQAQSRQAEAAAIAASQSSVAQQQDADQRAAQNLANAAQALGSDISNITSDINSVSSQLKTVSTDLGTQDTDLATVKNDAATAAKDLKAEGKDGVDVCSDVGTVGSDAATVASDEATVQADTTDSNIQGLTQDLATLTTDQAAEEAAQSAAPNYSPAAGSSSAADVQTSLSGGQGALAKWNSDTKTALAKAHQGTDNAQTIAKQAGTAARC